MERDHDTVSLGESPILHVKFGTHRMDTLLTDTHELWGSPQSQPLEDIVTLSCDVWGILLSFLRGNVQ